MSRLETLAQAARRWRESTRLDEIAIDQCGPNSPEAAITGEEAAIAVIELEAAVDALESDEPREVMA